MNYILNPNIALRSWWRAPYAYYIKGTRDAQRLTKEEFELLSLCDSQTDLDNVAGGACGYADDGRKIVDPKCRCQTSFSCKNGCGKDVNYGTGKCNV